MTKQSLKGTIFKEPDLAKTFDKSFVSNTALKYQGLLESLDQNPWS